MVGKIFLFMEILSKYSWLLALVFVVVASYGLRQQIKHVVAADAALERSGRWIFRVAVFLATAPWLMEGLSLLTSGAQHRSFLDRCHDHLYLRVFNALWLLTLWSIVVWMWLFGGGRILARFGLNQRMSPITYSVIFTVVTLLFSLTLTRCLF